MKIMVCKICGSKQVIKDNDVFVCRDCGASYVLEEARQLLRDINEKEKPVTPIKKEPLRLSASDELELALFLWAKNLQLFSNSKKWFNFDIANNCSEYFWVIGYESYLNNKPEVLFPSYGDDTLLYLDNIQQGTFRFFNGKKPIDYFNEKIKLHDSYQQLINKLRPYAGEVINHKGQIEPKYRLLAVYDESRDPNYDDSYVLNEYVNSNPDCWCWGADATIKCYYHEYNIFGKAKPVNGPAEIESLVQTIVDKVNESIFALDEAYEGLMKNLTYGLIAMRGIYQEIFANCYVLERALKLPYTYRRVDIILDMINIVKEQKIESFDKLVNIYNAHGFPAFVSLDKTLLGQKLIDLQNELAPKLLIVDGPLKEAHTNMVATMIRMNSIEQRVSEYDIDSFVKLWDDIVL